MHSGGHPQRRPAGLWSRPTMPIRRVYAPKLSHVCQGGHVLLLQMSHGFTWKRDSMSRFGPQQRGTLLRGALGSTSCSWPLGSSDLPTHKRREPQARAVVEARPPAFDQPRATPERHRLRSASMHRLENGHPAHVFTDEDRRRAAAITNQIRRERAEILALELENQALERRLAVVEARRLRKRDYARRRRDLLRAEAKEVAEAAAATPEWFARGYPSPSPDF
jgi:hypothetical protein